MLFWLMHFLEREVHLRLPSVFSYTSTRMMLASITSLLFCICIGPTFIKKLYELKIGQSIRKEDCALLGKLHEKKKDTPTMGGVLILSAMILSLFLWMDLSNIFTLLLLLTTVILGLIGGWDDYLKLKFHNTKGLSAKKKLLYQSIVAFCIAAYLLIPSVSQELKSWTGLSPPLIKVEHKEKVTMETSLGVNREHLPAMTAISLQEFALRIYIPFFKGPVVTLNRGLMILMCLFFWFVIVGSSNGVNLTDGLDGLATGCLIMVASALGLVAFLSNNFDIARYLHIPYIEGSGEIAIYMSAFAGACLGFLWYNGHPAQVFMGDTGSLALGAVIGVSAVLLKREVLLGIVGGIFVAEAASVILQVGSFKFRNKKRIFLIAPLHHHFEYQGWSETKVVVRFWIIGLLLAIIGIASLKFQ